MGGKTVGELIKALDERNYDDRVLINYDGQYCQEPRLCDVPVPVRRQDDDTVHNVVLLDVGGKDGPYILGG